MKKTDREVLREIIPDLDALRAADAAALKAANELRRLTPRQDSRASKARDVMSKIGRKKKGRDVKSR